MFSIGQNLLVFKGYQNRRGLPFIVTANRPVLTASLPSPNQSKKFQLGRRSGLKKLSNCQRYSSLANLYLENCPSENTAVRFQSELTLHCAETCGIQTDFMRKIPPDLEDLKAYCDGKKVRSTVESGILVLTIVFVC